MRIAGVRLESLLDGSGVNLVIFFQGCTIHCKGCHNKELQDPTGGKEITEAKDVLKYLTPATTGIVFSGGEPTEQIDAVLTIANIAKEKHLQTILFSGHTYDYLIKQPYWKEVLKTFDYVKAGPFIESLRNTANGPMGSTNQRMYKIVQRKVIL